MRIAYLVAAAVLLAGCAHGQSISASQVNLYTSAPVACPYGYATADGCAGALSSGTVFLSGSAFPAFADPAGKTILTSHPQPFNVAGWDYPVGYPGSQGALLDPSTTPPTGCTYASNILTCTDANPAHTISVIGYDFSLHNGIQLFVSGSNQAAIDIEKNNFARGSATRNIYMMLINNNGTTQYSVTFQYNTWNGGGQNNTQVYNNKAGIDVQDVRSNATTVNKYNDVEQVANRWWGGSNIGALTSKYNFFYNLALTDYVHNEIYGYFPAVNQTSAAYVFDYNTSVLSSAVWAASVTTPFYIASAGRNNSGFVSAEVIGNTQINNLAANCFGAYTCATGTTATAFIDDGLSTGCGTAPCYDGVAGTILTVTNALWPTIDQSQTFTGAGIPTTSGGKPTATNGFGNGVIPDLNGPHHWETNLTSNLAIAPETVTFAGTLGGSNNTAASLFEISAAYVTGNLTVQNNYIGSYGATACIVQAAYASFTYYIDDGLGGGSYDGVPGNVVTISSIGGTPGDELILTGATLMNNNGHIVATANQAPTITGQLSGSTGLAGTYSISGSAVAVPSYSGGETSTQISGTTTITPNYSLYNDTGHVFASNLIVPGGPQWNIFTSGSQFPTPTATCNGAVGHP